MVGGVPFSSDTCNAFHFPLVMTSQVRQDPQDLLEHLSQYGVVICRSCKFAVQPQALASHLLRHQVYRDERRQILDRFSALGLHEPDDVPEPDSNGPPIPHLPLYQGYICVASGCTHSCVSQKRMFQHWSEVHGEPDSKKVKSRPATLQTFFRGNKIRYFEVDGSYQDPVPETSTSAQAAGHRSPAGIQRYVVPSPSISDEQETTLDAPPDLDMQALQYFYHYQSTPYLIPHHGESGSERFWTETVYHVAFKHQFLMYAILSVAATHSAAEASDLGRFQVHREAAVLYQSAGLTGFREVLKNPDATNSTALIAYGRFRGVQKLMTEQIEENNVFAATQRTRNANDPSYVTEMFSSIRGDAELLLTLQHLLPPGLDFIFRVDQANAMRLSFELEGVEEDLMVSLHIPPAFFQRLDALPQRLLQLRALHDGNELQAVTEAKTALIAGAGRSYAAGSLPALWNGIETFVQGVPDHFIHMLEAQRPAALVVFAHWCPLLLRLEPHHFFLQGQSAKLLRIVRANLSPELNVLLANLEQVF